MLPQRTVLIVDDSPEDRQLYQRYLERDDLRSSKDRRDYSYNILEASSGQQGLELWQQYLPDVVLLDYRLPDLDGAEFLAQLQSLISQPSLPVIVVTGQGNEAIAVQAIKAGAQDYLVKGQITPERLQLAVNGAIVTAQLSTQLQVELGERQRAEAALHQSEAFKDRILASSPDCINLLTLDGRLIYTNRSGLKLMEIDDFTPYLNARWVDFWQGKYRQQAEQAFSSARAGKAVTFQGYCPTAKGTSKWWEVVVSPIQNAAGQIEQVLSISRDISDRIQSELFLRESETRLEMVQSATRSGVWDWDITTNLMYVSQKYCTLFGIDPAIQTVTYEHWLSFLHPADRALADDQVTRAIQQQQDYYESEYRVLHPDGLCWLVSRGQIFYNEFGVAVRMLGNVQDMTDRKQTEMALRQITKRLDIVLKSAPIILFNQDSDLRYTWIHNPVFSLSSEKIIGQQDTDLLSLEDASDLTQLKRRVFETGVGLREEVKITQGGQDFYYDLTIAPVQDRHNVVVEITCAAVDISDRKQAEIALQTSEERLRLALRGAKQGTWDWDLETQVLTWDDRCKEIFGLPAGFLVTYEWHLAALHPDDRAATAQAVQVALRDRTEFDTEYRTFHPDGTMRWILTRGCGYYNAAGEPIRMAGTVMDITDRKQAEAERAHLLELEQAARAEAERANHIKDEFLTVLSHELRSPLNPILGWAMLLQTHTFDAAKTAEALAIIERNARLQTQLIDDLLDVARILRGKFAINSVPLDLATVIASTIDMVNIGAIAKSIEIRPMLAPIGHVLGDPTRLQQIFWNLLSNAIKFTPEGGRIDLALEQVNQQAQITVKDTGKGISPDFLPHIFELFRQEDASTTRKYGGLGLGLAIVRHLVEAHGGTIIANSPGEEQGSTFTVRLPLLKSQAELQEIIEPQQPDLDLRGIRVLAIDDEVDARHLLTTVLTQHGAEVTTVALVADFFTALETFHPDVVISDIGMPEVDGYALLQQVRALSAEPGGQVHADSIWIALTAYARPEDEQKALAAGFQQHIAKPVQPNQLVAAIARLVKSRSQPKSLSSVDALLEQAND